MIDDHLSLEANEIFDGEIKLDESYFGSTRKGKRVLMAVDKIAVFGILNQEGRVYTIIMSDTKQSTLMPIIKCKIKPDGFVYTDSYRSYNTLDISEFRFNYSSSFNKLKMLRK